MHSARLILLTVGMALCLLASSCRKSGQEPNLHDRTMAAHTSQYRRPPDACSNPHVLAVDDGYNVTTFFGSKPNMRSSQPRTLPSIFWPSGLWAEDAVIIGATRQQERFLTCVAQISADDLRDTPNCNERLTVVILEHQKFLEMREGFHAHKTKLAFSSLQARRIYLSARMFRDFESLLRCITHELGHFATQSLYEGNAELAAERFRKTARQSCPADVQ